MAVIDTETTTCFTMNCLFIPACLIEMNKMLCFHCCFCHNIMSSIWYLRVHFCVHLTAVLEQGNIQRCNHYAVQMNDVKSSLERFIGERRPRAVEIISRHQSKRAVKKKERLWCLDDEVCQTFHQRPTVATICCVPSANQLSCCGLLSLQWTLHLSDMLEWTVYMYRWNLQTPQHHSCDVRTFELHYWLELYELYYKLK